MLTHLSVLLVSHNKALRQDLHNTLNRLTEDIEVIGGEYQALQLLKLKYYHIVIIDQDGLLLNMKEIIRLIYGKGTHILFLTSTLNDLENLQEELHLGKFDYFPKSLPYDYLISKIEEIIYAVEIQAEYEQIKKSISNRYGITGIIGNCGQMRKVFESIHDVADSAVTVFIHGQSGTGKELVAKAIHKNSPRQTKPFIAVNCAAIPEHLLESELFGYEKGAFTGAVGRKAGKFEVANRGTLFLDEIGDMSLITQSKILRVLEDRTFERVGGAKSLSVDVRIISATNRVLEEDVKAGRFREDLYYRLHIYPIHLPPLRERTGDINLLTTYFIQTLSQKNNRSIIGIQPDAVTMLNNYIWPGNVRELENVIERAIILSKGQELMVSDFPQLKEKSRKLQDTRIDMKPQSITSSDIKPLNEIEKNYIEQALSATGGNISLTAKQLKISRATLYRKIEKYQCISPLDSA